MKEENRAGRLKRLAELSVMLSGTPMEILGRVAGIIAELVGVPVVCISEVRGDELRFLAVCTRGETTLDAGSCPLDITPCATVEGSGVVRVYDNVAEKFPKAGFLKDHNAYSYCGFPARDAEGKVISVTCLIDDRPHEFSEEDKSLLMILAQRIGVEIERRKYHGERDRAHEALQRSEERYRLILKNLNEIIYQVDVGDGYFYGEVQYVSPRCRDILGYAPEEFIDDPGLWFNTIHPDDRQGLIEATRDIFENKKTGTRVYRMRHKETGEYLWFEDKVVPMADSMGEMTAFFGVAHDMTERKRMEDTLRESEGRLRAIIDNTQAAIYVKDLDGRHTLLNSWFDAVSGSGRGALLGKTDYEVLPKEAADVCRESDLKVIESRAPMQLEETFELMGKTRIFLTSKFPLTNASGELYAVGGISVDITEQKKMADELLKSQKLESLGVLAGGIAHDFNNLLTGILGNLSLLEQKVERAGDLYRRLKEVEKAAVHAQELTQQLLTFSRGGEPVKEVISIGELLEEACGFALRGSNVGCEGAIAEDLRPAEADRGQIIQLINNMIINAKQAMPEGGTLKVRAENSIVGPEDNLPIEDGRYLKISIEDQGVGIPKKHLARIFDPYFTTKQKGSGLGLASAYSVVKRHGGHIAVDSEPGVGTTFVIYLPASDKDVPAEAAAGEEVVHAPAGGRVLVMDDEEIIRAVAADILTSIGYRVQTSKEGAEAISLYREARERGEPFDAVIMDLTIPGGMGGTEAVGEILKIDPDAKVIVSSGYSNDPVMSDFRRFGFSGVVTKPYNATELGAKVRQVIAKEG